MNINEKETNEIEMMKTVFTHGEKRANKVKHKEPFDLFEKQFNEFG